MSSDIGNIDSENESINNSFGDNEDLPNESISDQI